MSGKISGGTRDRLLLIGAFFLFGTIGLFRRMIVCPSGVVAMGRGAIGALTLLLFRLAAGKKPDKTAIRRRLPGLLVSGAMIGFNWILLFEAYNHTTVATATLCYYMAPVLIILAAPLVLKEKITLKKGVCAAVAAVGMAMVSGVFSEKSTDTGDLRGVVLGLGAAVLYAGVILLNKRIRGISAYDRTMVQLAAAAAVMLPYTAATGELKDPGFAPGSLLLLLLVGVLHTGLAYAAYFGALERLPAQTCAVFSYIDPVTAVLLSALLLREPMDLWGILGAILILGAAAAGEIQKTKRVRSI